LTPFNETDFLLLEEADVFIAIDDEPISLEFDATYYDPEGDILILEALLNNDPEPPSNQKNYFPSVHKDHKDHKVVEPKNNYSSDDKPPEVELKELPPHLEYAFLGDNEKWPVIIAKDLSVNEKTALINVLKSRKKAIAWKLTDIRGIGLEFCSHKILLKEDFSPKEKLSEIARTTMNEHCSAVILNKLPRKLGDPGKFLIPCEFSGMDECLALAALVSKAIGISKDVSFKVGVFHFPSDFVVVDFEPDPRVPLILGRCFLKTRRALIDVHKEELTLRIGNEAITYNLDQTVRYSANYNQMTANKIDVIKSACEEYSQEVLGFSNVTTSGTPTPQNDPIISAISPTLTPFRDSDFLLFEEADAFLGLEDDLDSSKINPFYYDPEGDILLLEAILNKVELKDLPHHLEYAFLEGDIKLPVFIAKELGSEEKSALIKVLKSHKRAITWKLSDIQCINLKFCTHKILIEEDYKPAVQHQRRVNPKIHDVIKKEVEKLLDVGLIYPISDSPWVIPVHCVPKKGGFTVVENEENELIPTRLVIGWRLCIDYRNPWVIPVHCVPKKGGFTVVENEENELIPTRLVIGWRVCIDYRKLNEATRKDHFPLPFMDQMLERLAGNEYYCFLDGFSGYIQIPIDPRDQEKTTFTCPYGTFVYRHMPFGLCNAPSTFQRCMLAIFYDMVEKTMEVFMDDFSVFGNSFENCLPRLDKMLQRCEDTNLSLN
nr:reverse transcriptase domain-containing protein [Tanacetum cinerariifolium]